MLRHLYSCFPLPRFSPNILKDLHKATNIIYKDPVWQHLLSTLNKSESFSLLRYTCQLYLTVFKICRKHANGVFHELVRFASKTRVLDMTTLESGILTQYLLVQNRCCTLHILQIEVIFCSGNRTIITV